MTDKDKLKELEQYVTEQKIEDGIRKGLTKWAHTICMTATSALMATVYTVGHFVYEKWQPLQEAIRAFLEANER